MKFSIFIEADGVISRWKVLDFAELKRTSVSFFDIEKPETAVSRWSRAKSRAAKVNSSLKEKKNCLHRFPSIVHCC